ncbi:hydroxycarboxylic acid receptor 2-like isoform X1 [Hypanus sabinus]|uniref:hydroxycarboxylic acid receptor 2-like isoform X1 n=2 Tax=Hypanus sabinus TaxID=79690 RepID=UPI0028C4377D|nr:hydroxycarboxylic acid receptor 2-like isoform X1 [Hypanus sabinus]
MVKWRRGETLLEVQEINIHANRLEATQTVYKVLFLHPKCGLITAMEKAMDGHIGMEMMASMEKTSNSSPTVRTNGTCFFDEQFLTRMIPPALTIFFILAVSFNSLTLWIFCSQVKKKAPIDILMLNLCLGDLLFSFTYPLLITYHSNNNHWIFGELLCKLQTFFIYFILMASVFFLICISTYRCYMVLKSIQSKNRITKKCTIALSILIWLLTGFVTSPAFSRTRVFKMNGRIHCMSLNHPDIKKVLQSSTVKLFILSFVIPFVTLLVSTLLVQRKLANLTLAARSQKFQYAVRMMIVILCIFVICFLPVNVARLVISTVGMNNCTLFQQLGVAYYWCLLAIYSNTILDPIVYFYASTKYRTMFINTIKGMGFCKKLPGVVSNTQSTSESTV